MEPEVPLLGLAAVPIIAALLQAVKMAWPGEKFNGWLPLTSILLGVGWNVLANIGAGETVTATTGLIGVVVGLAASGLYSQTKTVVVGK